MPSPISSTGLNTTAITTTMNTPLSAEQADINFSPNGNKLAITTTKKEGLATTSLLQIYDFNSVTGTFTLYKQHLYEDILQAQKEVNHL